MRLDDITYANPLGRHLLVALLLVAWFLGGAHAVAHEVGADAGDCFVCALASPGDTTISEGAILPLQPPVFQRFHVAAASIAPNTAVLRPPTRAPPFLLPV